MSIDLENVTVSRGNETTLILPTQPATGYYKKVVMHIPSLLVLVLITRKHHIKTSQPVL